jgi:hypothetical protein
MPVVLDQASFETLPVAGGAGFWGPGAASPSDPKKDIAQTFTVANTGLLTEVDVVVNLQPGFPNGEMFFDVRPVHSGVPVEDDEQAIAAVTLSSVPLGTGLTILGFAGLRIPVTQGELLAIVLRGSPGVAFAWFAHTYDRGQGFLRQGVPPFETWTPYFGGPPGQTIEFAFRTFVECADEDACVPFVFGSSVPAPPTIVLLDGALVLIVGARCFAVPSPRGRPIA